MKYADEAYLVAHRFHTCFNESVNSTYAEFIPKGKYYGIGISLTVVSRNEGKQGIKLLRDAILYALENPHTVTNYPDEDKDLVLNDEDISKAQVKKVVQEIGTNSRKCTKCHQSMEGHKRGSCEVSNPPNTQSKKPKLIVEVAYFEEKTLN